MSAKPKLRDILQNTCPVLPLHDHEGEGKTGELLQTGDETKEAWQLNALWSLQLKRDISDKNWWNLNKVHGCINSNESMLLS